MSGLLLHYFSQLVSLMKSLLANLKQTYRADILIVSIAFSPKVPES